MDRQHEAFLVEGMVDFDSRPFLANDTRDEKVTSGNRLRECYTCDDLDFRYPNSQ